MVVRLNTAAILGVGKEVLCNTSNLEIQERDFVTERRINISFVVSNKN